MKNAKVHISSQVLLGFLILTVASCNSSFRGVQLEADGAKLSLEIVDSGYIIDSFWVRIPLGPFIEWKLLDSLNGQSKILLMEQNVGYSTNGDLQRIPTANELEIRLYASNPKTGDLACFSFGFDPRGPKLVVKERGRPFALD